MRHLYIKGNKITKRKHKIIKILVKDNQNAKLRLMDPKFGINHEKIGYTMVKELHVKYF